MKHCPAWSHTESTTKGALQGHNLNILVHPVYTIHDYDLFRPALSLMGTRCKFCRLDGLQQDLSWCAYDSWYHATYGMCVGGPQRGEYEYILRISGLRWSPLLRLVSNVYDTDSKPQLVICLSIINHIIRLGWVPGHWARQNSIFLCIFVLSLDHAHGLGDRSF